MAESAAGTVQHGHPDVTRRDLLQLVTGATAAIGVAAALASASRSSMRRCAAARLAAARRARRAAAACCSAAICEADCCRAGDHGKCLPRTRPASAVLPVRPVLRLHLVRVAHLGIRVPRPRLQGLRVLVFGRSRALCPSPRQRLVVNRGVAGTATAEWRTGVRQDGGEQRCPGGRVPAGGAALERGGRFRDLTQQVVDVLPHVARA